MVPEASHAATTADQLTTQCYEMQQCDTQFQTERRALDKKVQESKLKEAEAKGQTLDFPEKNDPYVSYTKEHDSTEYGLALSWSSAVGSFRENEVGTIIKTDKNTFKFIKKEGFEGKIWTETPDIGTNEKTRVNLYDSTQQSEKASKPPKNEAKTKPKKTASPKKEKEADTQSKLQSKIDSFKERGVKPHKLNISSHVRPSINFQLNNTEYYQGMPTSQRRPLQTAVMNNNGVLESRAGIMIHKGNGRHLFYRNPDFRGSISTTLGGRKFDLGAEPIERKPQQPRKASESRINKAGSYEFTTKNGKAKVEFLDNNSVVSTYHMDSNQFAGKPDIQTGSLSGKVVLEGNKLTVSPINNKLKVRIDGVVQTLKAKQDQETRDQKTNALIDNL